MWRGTTPRPQLAGAPLKLAHCPLTRSVRTLIGSGLIQNEATVHPVSARPKVLLPGQLHVDERDRLLRPERGQLLTRGRMAVATQRLERRVGDFAREAECSRAVTDPLTEDGFLALGPVVVSAQVVMEVVRSVANDAGGDHALHHGGTRSPPQRTASPEFGVSALPVPRCPSPPSRCRFGARGCDEPGWFPEALALLRQQTQYPPDFGSGNRANQHAENARERRLRAPFPGPRKPHGNHPRSAQNSTDYLTNFGGADGVRKSSRCR